MANLTYLGKVENDSDLATKEYVDSKILGDVVGPSSATNENLVSFNLTTGKLIKDSGSKVADFATASHEHGSISSLGAIGVVANLPVCTTTDGVLAVLPAGASTQYLNGLGAWATPPNTNTYVTQTVTTTNATYPILFSNTADKSTTSATSARISSLFKANPSTGDLTATTFTGNLIGDATGSSGSCTGNASTATASTTAALGTDTTAIATTAFVQAAIEALKVKTAAYTMTAGQTVISITAIWTNTAFPLIVYRNGLRLIETVDYTSTTSTKVITLTTASIVGEVVFVVVSPLG